MDVVAKHLAACPHVPPGSRAPRRALSALETAVRIERIDPDAFSAIDTRATDIALLDGRLWTRIDPARNGDHGDGEAWLRAVLEGRHLAENAEFFYGSPVIPVGVDGIHFDPDIDPAATRALRPAWREEGADRLRRYLSDRVRLAGDGAWMLWAGPAIEFDEEASGYTPPFTYGFRDPSPLACAKRDAAALHAVIGPHADRLAVESGTRRSAVGLEFSSVAHPVDALPDAALGGMAAARSADAVAGSVLALAGLRHLKAAVSENPMLKPMLAALAEIEFAARFGSLADDGREGTLALCGDALRMLSEGVDGRMAGRLPLPAESIQATRARMHLAVVEGFLLPAVRKAAAAPDADMEAIAALSP